MNPYLGFSLLSHNPSLWIFSDAQKKGSENQCAGLAEALELEPVFWRFSKPFYFSLLPRRLWPVGALREQNGQTLIPPWPHLVVASGHTSMLPALRMRGLSGGKTFVIALQNPGFSPKKFDLVIAPAHDNLKGQNVIQTVGALHNVTQQKTRQEAYRLWKRFSFLPQPWVALLIGGESKHFSFTQDVAMELVKDMHKLHAKTGAGFMITCSRRTPEKLRDIFKKGFAQIPSVYWDLESTEENPYLAYLGMADYIVVTKDSVSMASEAAATDKPLYVYPLPGYSKKIEKFYESFERQGICRPFEGGLSFWARTPYQEALWVAKEVKKNLPFLAED